MRPEETQVTRRGALEAVVGQGQSIWIDVLSRAMLDSGQLHRLVKDAHVVGVTSNPTIFKQALAAGDAYDAALKSADPDLEAKAVFWDLATKDVVSACDILTPVYEGGVAGRDGYVSLEVDPHLVDAEAIFEEATRLRNMVSRPNLMIKIPATDTGLTAIERVIASGCSVNATLIFSLERHAQVIDAYLRGLEQLVADGRDASAVASVASFFISRVDNEVDRRLDGADGADAVKGKMAIANAKLAYQQYCQAFSGARWQRLAGAGATPQRCLWASTSTKNPAYRDVMYVEELVGPDTVNTMPIGTLAALADHGRVLGTPLTAEIDEAYRVFAAVAAAGIDSGDVAATLEHQGIAAFRDAFDELLVGIDARRRLLDRDVSATTS